MKLKKYEARFDVSLSVDIEVTAPNAKVAEEKFEAILEDGALEIIERGCVTSEHIEWDSSLEEIVGDEDYEDD